MEYDFLHLEMAICINLRGFIFYIRTPTMKNKVDMAFRLPSIRNAGVLSIHHESS